MLQVQYTITNRSNSDYSKTLNAINDKLIKTHGGYLNIRCVNGVKYLDYLNDFGHINRQVIRFGVNLLDLTKYIKADDLKTAIIPIGNDNIDITSVNNGKDFVFDENAVSLYGWIYDTVKFDDVTLPENLLSKAKAYLDDCINLSTTLELSAIDLSIIGVDIEKIKLGDWIRVVSKPHNLDRLFLVTKYDLDLTKPQNNKITMGSVLSTLTSSTTKAQNEISERVSQVAKSLSNEINEKVKNATELITGGKGGYVVLNITEDGHTDEILIMDAPDREQATNVIRLNKNGIGFSTTGYDGNYANAWTIDGNLVADYITTGSMLADRIRGGTLELGGTGLGKDGSIIIRDSNNNVIAQINKSGIVMNAGSINLNNKFIVNSNGEITAKSGTFSGTVKGATVQVGALENTKYDLEASESGVIARNRFYLQDYTGKVYLSFKDTAKGKLNIENAVLKIGNKIRLDSEGDVAVFSTPQEIFIIGQGTSGGTWIDGDKKTRTLSDGTTVKAWDIGDAINYLAKRQIEEYNFSSTKNQTFWDAIDGVLKYYGLIT